MEFQIFSAVNKFQLFLKISLRMIISFLEDCKTLNTELQMVNNDNFPNLYLQWHGICKMCLFLDLISGVWQKVYNHKKAVL